MAAETAAETIAVYARLRAGDNDTEVSVDSNKPGSVIARNLEFNLDNAFDNNAAQSDVYEVVGRNLVERVVSGFNAAVLAAAEGSDRSGASWLIDQEAPLNALYTSASTRVAGADCGAALGEAPQHNTSGGNDRVPHSSHALLGLTAPAGIGVLAGQSLTWSSAETLALASGQDSNLAVGGQAEATVLSERERRICEALTPSLRSEGLFFVGIDVIDGMLSEINVTSPTGIREVERLMQQPLADQVIERLRGLL